MSSVGIHPPKKSKRPKGLHIFLLLAQFLYFFYFVLFCIYDSAYMAKNISDAFKSRRGRLALGQCLENSSDSNELEKFYDVNNKADEFQTNVLFSFHV